MVEAGQYVTDGTVTWIVTDVRDGAQVGDIKLSPVLRRGYVQANGALLTSASVNYPRLVDFVQDNPSLLAADDTVWATNEGLYVYDDTNDTLRVPNFIDRVMQGGDTVEEKEAGLPNITGGTEIWVGSSQGVANTDTGVGALLLKGSATRSTLNVGNAAYYAFLQLDASHSNPIYGNSTTIQPPAITLIPQIKY